MRKILMIPTVALLSVGTAMLASTGANAQFLHHAPLIQNEVADATDGSAEAVIQVQYRKRKKMRRGYRGRNHRGDIAVGIIGAIVGGAIIANEANRRDRHRDRRHIRADRHVSWCYERYRSYRERDNSYQPYNGRRRQCNSPYY